MSLAEKIKEAFGIVEPALEHEAAKLLQIIFDSPDPRAGLEKARRAVITDAANAAADQLLESLLPPDNSPPAGSEPLPSSIPPVFRP